MKTAYKLMMALIAVIALSATAAQAQITSASVGTTTATSTPYGITLNGSFSGVMMSMEIVNSTGASVALFGVVDLVSSTTKVITPVLSTSITQVADTYTVSIFQVGPTYTTTFTVVAGPVQNVLISGVQPSAVAGTLSGTAALLFRDQFNNSTAPTVSPTVLSFVSTATATSAITPGVGNSYESAVPNITTAGTYTLSIDGFSGSYQGTTSVTIVAAQPDTARTELVVPEEIAGVQFGVLLTITDAFGNVTNNSVTPTVQFTSATSTATFTLANTGTGTYTTTATLTTATVYTGVMPSFSGSTSLSTTMTITPDIALVTRVSAPLTTTANTTGGTITYRSYDQFGNPAPVIGLTQVQEMPLPIGFNPMLSPIEMRNLVTVTTGVYRLDLPALLVSQIVPAGTINIPTTSQSYQYTPIFLPNPGGTTINALLGAPTITSATPSLAPLSTTVSFTLYGTNLQQPYIIFPAIAGMPTPGYSAIVDNQNVSNALIGLYSNLSPTSATVEFTPPANGSYTLHYASPAGVTTITLFVGTPGEISNNNDAGPGSLRDAVMMASTGTTLTIPASLVGEVITLTGGPITIDKLMSIVSTSGTVFIDANGGPAFVFECGSTYTEIKGVQVFNTGGHPVAVSNCGDTRIVNTQKKQIPG